MPGTVLFRLRCGHRAWSRWLEEEGQVWEAAVDKGIASRDARGRPCAGPLMWIEKGHRLYVGRRIVPLTTDPAGRPLVGLYANPLAR